LFLCPLYSLYKAATAISVAHALEQETGVRCVPVFWLQSEDHDFAEIDHTVVHDREGALTRLQLASVHTPRASVSTVRLGAGVEAVLAQLHSALESQPHADEVLALLSRHYVASATWVDAFAGVMSEVFPELVLLDPRDEAIAAHVRPVHQRAMAQCHDVTRVLAEREAALEAAGFDVQVTVREAPLSFVHPEGRDGPRFRLAPTGEMPVDPLCLSTSALLRPIVQDTLLPTAAIIGGPGELNYFAQLPPLYAHFGLPMPMVMPRARFRVVEPRVRSLLATLGLQAGDVETTREALLRRVTQAAVLPSPRPSPLKGERENIESIENIETRLVQAVEAVLSDVHGVDDAVARTRATIARAANRLALRYSRAQTLRDQTLIARVDRLQRVQFPDGAPQERVLGFAGFAARMGLASFISMVREGVVPFDGALKELSP
jgi:bacillithiol synthase